jgi:TPR repeat protein
MKRTLLFVLALAVIPVGVDAQVTPSDSCSDIDPASPLEDVRSCAEQGDARAQETLGIRYAAGTGVPVDNVLAYMWLNLAAAQGRSLAPVFRDRTAQQMTREQIGEAQRLSREWLEAHPSSA